MPRHFPDPQTRNPVRLPDGTDHEGTVFLRAAIDHPRMTLGDYSYASAHVPPVDWATHLAPYLFPGSPEQLIIGKFCQIADGVLFITASANHRYDGISSFPFAIFDGGIGTARPSLPDPGPDTVLGHDIWVGQGARILPGAKIGSGAIIGAGAVVAGEVPPYAIVTGNPAYVKRHRFDAATIAQLLEIGWWDWPIDTILAHEGAISGGDITALATISAAL